MTITRRAALALPGLALLIAVLAINLVGDGLRDAFDPRQRRMPKSSSLWTDAKKMFGGKSTAKR